MDVNLPDISPEMVEHLKQKTGLLSTTIVDMLSKGWRLVENIGEISRWEHPMWSISERVI